MDGGVLIADLIGDGVLESALRKIGVLEECEEVESAGLDLRVGGGLGDFLELIEEG